ncbi:acyl-CoA reductase [Alteromonas sp. H39]|uniref:acyl-CoA reductase n=1 Tax=Alteromonas sp. H39 TaxID=3389876 RepID=UPI0039DF34C6
MTLKIVAPSHAGTENTLNEWALWQLSPMAFACDGVIAFLQEMSTRIMRSHTCREHSELVALAFWLREASTRQMLGEYPANTFKALGTVVHFTPANVDTMFIYSWVCSLLAGNKNVVRVSSRSGDVQAEILAVLNEVFAKPDYRDIAGRNVFIQYQHDVTEGTDYTASLCQQADARILWGGDDSVNAIRQFPCKPRCRDISFADRYSASLIDAGAVSQEYTAQQAMRLLLKDIAPYEQQACSSPRVLFWLGSAESLSQFLTVARTLPLAQDDVSVTTKNEQLITVQSVQLTTNVNQVINAGPLCAIECEAFDESLLVYHVGRQVLLCQCVDSINKIADEMSARLQTLSYFGVPKEALVKFIGQPSITGIDRVVPLGRALEFAPQWDGYELISQLARRVVIE